MGSFKRRDYLSFDATTISDLVAVAVGPGSYSLALLA
jgi:hypothetical protein